MNEISNIINGLDNECVAIITLMGSKHIIKRKGNMFHLTKIIAEEKHSKALLNRKQLVDVLLKERGL